VILSTVMALLFIPATMDVFTMFLNSVVSNVAASGTSMFKFNSLFTTVVLPVTFAAQVPVTTHFSVPAVQALVIVPLDPVLQTRLHTAPGVVCVHAFRLTSSTLAVGVRHPGRH
jgi:hypothetical protein